MEEAVVETSRQNAALLKEIVAIRKEIKEREVSRNKLPEKDAVNLVREELKQIAVYVDVVQAECCVLSSKVDLVLIAIENLLSGPKNIVKSALGEDD